MLAIAAQQELHGRKLLTVLVDFGGEANMKTRGGEWQ